MALPADGQTGWGDILNSDINTLQTQANGTQTGLNNHASNNPSDPHGDRAYAQSLVSPIINGVNQANGYVQLNSSGLIPGSLITGAGENVIGGMYNAVFDCVATYGAVPDNGADQSGAIQSALNVAATSGGGIVWLGPGTFSMGGYIVLPSNVWFMMSEGTVLSRIPGNVNAPYLITNVRFQTSNTPSTNLRITGGRLDAVGANSMSSACTPIFIIQSSKTKIENVSVNNVYSNPAVEINGCTNAWIESCYFDGVGTNSFFGSGSTAPAVRINSSSTSTTPSGLSNTFYNNTICYGVHLSSSQTVSTTYSYGCYGALIGSDLFSSHNSDHIFINGCGTAYTSQLGSAIYSNSNWRYSTNTGNLFYESNP